MGKKVPNKNRTITFNLFHDGAFTVRPFEYAVSDIKQITDIHFEGTPLRISIKPIQNDSDVDQFVNFAYKNKWQINLYVEHSGYDVLDIRDQGETMADDGNESSDAYCSSDEEDLSYVDFHSELDDNVVINTVSTNDPFLNKLCGDNPEFINLVDEPVNENVETVEEDTENIDHVFNVKEGISYVTHDPNQDWKKMEPILGMRFHHPEQLKLCLANYGVANGYPLWFYRNDWRKLLVYCGRDVESGRCAGADSLKKRKKKELGEDESLKVNKVSTSKSPKTPVKAVNSGEACSESPKWTKSKAILDSNPGSTCRLDDEETESGNYYFRRFYVCFKGVKDGLLAGCRKVIGLDGCFLKHTCRGELLVAMGKDANNQMYPIAWAVVKGLLEGVNELLPNDEHRKCTRHLFANYKKKSSGVQLQCLFWNAASTTVEQLYYSKMEELKIISTEAYQYLCDRNPNSWCRAFFRQESKCPNFENGICESFNRAILVQRTKPIITMLEDIRLYVMQRLVAMNRVARTWEHNITPSIRKRVEVLKKKQRTMPGRPRKSRMKGQSENNSQVSRVGRKMTCTNCQETGHNKSSCKNHQCPNLRSIDRQFQNLMSMETIGGGGGGEVSARGRGRGSRGGRCGFGGRGERTATMGDTGKSQRGRGKGQRGRGRGHMQRDGEQMTEDEIRKNLEHEYMEEMLLQEEQKIDA
ncbi:hypothetical protein Tco_0417162 [Tanacetum coccineum]